MVVTPFTSTRSIWPDMTALRTALRTVTGDPAAEIYPLEPFNMKQWLIQTANPLSGPLVAGVQSALDTASNLTPEILAQRYLATMPIEVKAILLALIDQLNTIRAALPVPLGAITPAQAVAAVVAKAGTL